ncbi:MAG TPA: LysR substrate-binding domain-containing protein [Polyangiaceae bacterium]|nr:LysR substrate-binding domain-containing protein [Polyangiaceae bacterium]
MRASPDDIVGMAFFARVVEARSFSDAARSLGLSKSAVSARVARLEERFGVRLLHRTTRRLALTADGVRLYERCARVVAEADEAAEMAAGASAAPRGVLRVHAPSAFGQAYLAGPIGDFLRSYPDVRVDLRLGGRAPDAAFDGLDVAVVIARRLADSGLSARKLATTGLVVCASREYLRRKGIPFRPQDLVHHECLSHAVLQADDWRFGTDEGVISIAGRARLVVDDTHFLREAVRAGLGIGMLPELFVAEDLAAGRLQRVLDGVLDHELGVFALHGHPRLAPASVRAFVDHLAACFRRPPWAEAARPPAPPPPPAKRPRRPGAAIPIVEQDIRRLEAVASLYADVDPAGAARLREALSRTKRLPASKIPRTAVTMNSRVKCRDAAGGERELSLTYPWDARDDRVSVLSPLGLALLGASVGQPLAGDERALTVASIPYQPEAAGDHHL